MNKLFKCEKEVFKEMVKGKINKEIVRVLFVLEKIVKIYVSYIFSKLEVFDRI